MPYLYSTYQLPIVGESMAISLSANLHRFLPSWISPLTQFHDTKTPSQRLFFCCSQGWAKQQKMQKMISAACARGQTVSSLDITGRRHFITSTPQTISATISTTVSMKFQPLFVIIRKRFLNKINFLSAHRGLQGWRWNTRLMCGRSNQQLHHSAPELSRYFVYM